MALTWPIALEWRLRRHHLGDERAGSVEAVVDRLVAVPSWSGDAATAIRLRLARPQEGDVAGAVAGRRVMSTFAFRGATHLMTPGSAAVHLALRCAGRQWERASWRTHYGLEPDEWPRLRATVRDALRGGPLTQHELAVAVTQDPSYRHLLSAFHDRSQTFLKPFAWHGDLSLGSTNGTATFQLLDGTPGWGGLIDLEEAGPRAIRAYLGAYGPASPDRLQYWLGEGLSAGRARIDRWIERVQGQVAALSIEGVDALCLAEHVEELERIEPREGVVLLPGSDQWVLGAGTSDARVVPPEHRAHATRGANLALIGGRVHGTWKPRRDDVEVRWFDGAPTVSIAAVQAAMARIVEATR